MQPVGRWSFLCLGLALFALKQFLDRAVAAHFGRGWGPQLYWFTLGVPMLSLKAPDREFLFAVAWVAVPFAVVGVWLTAKRLRSLGWPLWWAGLFFVPAVNVIFFGFLALAQRAAESEAPKAKEKVAGWWPESHGLSFAMAAAISAVAGLLSIAVVALLSPGYGWGIFFGVPFGMGLIATLLHSQYQERSFTDCLLASLASLVICGGLALTFAVEGGICLAMCLPIAVPIAVVGVAAGRAMIHVSPPVQRVSWLVFMALAILPAVAATDSATGPSVEVFRAVTAIEVNAPPDAVWKNVVEFSELPAPTEWIFRLGIAYPLQARIVGRGVGAVRYCEFSTGPFVEPITTWREPSLLAFDVAASPEPMRELSPYNIHPPHLDGFMKSRRGQFLLTPLDGGRRTRLEGTTWYSHGLYPEAYWRWWSDALIHRIHRRVLDHIRDLSERY